VAVTLDHRFFRTPDGVVWTNGPHAYPFWNRYLSVFDGVKVVARMRDALQPHLDWRITSGDGVQFRSLPDYVGPWQYLAKSVPVRRAVRGAVDLEDAVVMRVSSHIAGCLESTLRRRGQPYGVEVLNDPANLFAPGSVDYRLHFVFRKHFAGQLRRQCKQACAAAYVTEGVLQALYPCPRFQAAFSDVEIASQVLLEAPRSFSGLQDPQTVIRLVTVASLAQMYKAPDVLLRAVAHSIHAGWNLRLRMVGDGRYRAAMERLSADLGLTARVEFLGQLPAGARVMEVLDDSDLFVLPSRSEGLPRALIEAMARSLPCVASSVGGIPELLAPEDLVAPGDIDSLTRKLMEVIANPGRMDAMAARNLRRAGDFREDRLAFQRNAFYREVRRITSRHIQGGRQKLQLADSQGHRL
jgi:L-malate glycosyltransferase